MSAVRNREFEGGASVQPAALWTLTRLAFRALAVPVGPLRTAGPNRAELLREATAVGSCRRAEGGDVIALAADFLAVRADLRERHRRPARARVATRSPVGDGRAEALLDDVLVALVRGYEGSLELETSPASTGPDAAADPRASAHPDGSSKRE